MEALLTEEEVEQYRSGKGSSYMPAERVLELLPWLTENDLFIQSMEAVEVETESNPNNYGRMDLSILGLDGDEDWENHYDVARINRLAAQKVRSTLISGVMTAFQIWLDYGSEYDEERAFLKAGALSAD